MSTPTTKDDWTVVWIDSREALVACWHAGRPTLERLACDAPVHRLSRAAALSLSAGERHRLEQITRFLQLVANRLPPTAALTIIGPGSMAARLGGLVREWDRQHLRSRPIRYRRAVKLTEAQLLAELRALTRKPASRRALAALPLGQIALGPSGA